MAGTVSAKTVRAILGVARALGLDAGALARARGVDGALTDVDARFPHAAWRELWQDVIRETGSESIGIDAARLLPWGHFDVVDYLIGTSDDLATALRRFERYFSLVSTGVAHVLEDHGDRVHVVRRYAPDCYNRMLAPAEFAFAALVGPFRMLLGAHWSPTAVHFAAPAPSNDAAHRSFFGCPLQFDTALSAVVLERAALATPMPRPEPELARILERHAERLVTELGDESDVLAQVQRIVMRSLPDADVSLARVARALGMSARTLQRRLQPSGRTFDQLYDETRHHLARQYLADPAISIQETAHLLAFGDLRGFYRAFRRWEGCTPADFRRARVPRPGSTRPGAPRP